MLTDKIAVVTGAASGIGREIAAQFFALDALPGDMPQRMRDGLPGWITAMKAARLAG